MSRPAEFMTAAGQTEEVATSDPATSNPAGGRRVSRWWSLVLLVPLVALWEVVARLGWVSDRLLPSPSEVADAWISLLARGYFWDHLWSTLRVIVGGFLMASAAGALLAIVINMSSFIRRGVYPVIVAADVVPKIALIPLIIVTFGFGTTSRLIIVVTGSFFPVFLNTLTALANADRDGEMLLRSLGANKFQHLRMHKLPAGLPTIFAGLKISLTVAFIAGILAELLIRNEGLGYLITQYRSILRIDLVFAVTITVALIGMGLFFVMEWAERRIVFWVDTRHDVDAMPL